MAKLVWEARGEGVAVSSLRRIIGEHREYIEGTTKGPVVERSQEIDLKDMLVEEEQKVMKWGCCMNPCN